MDEPTAAAVWRRRAVQPVLDVYAAYTAVDAVTIAGSTAPVPAGAEVLRLLAEETYDLAELHLPEADADRLRGLFRADRRPLEKMTIR